MRFSALLALVPLALAAPSQRSSPAPLHVPAGAGSNLIKGKYIVKMYNNAATDSIQRTVSAITANADHVYTAPGFKGFAGALTNAEIKALQSNPDVSWGKSSFV